MAMIPSDYEERVYAGVLGKIIGVYLGRPFEGWTYSRIMRELGEVDAYVNDRIAHHPPLIVTDDDISGAFTFLRALPDYGNRRDIAPAQIGQTWLNYLIERQTILWWGGMGNSTEHTAYMRLKQGIPAPRSGSMLTNGKVVAEQIGAQIFIDGWAMVAPGDPGLAVDLARKAASVSHDGEAIYGAQVLAAMEALAFVEPDMDRLFDTAVSFIPRDSIIYRLIADVRDWRIQDGDWRKSRERLEAAYGYDKYGGNCHMVPNHGIIALALAYGADSFQRALMITNTCGWDTDCNSGNVGCLMGIKLGLAGIDGGPVDWRGPVADRLYLPTVDGGRAVTDAVQETYRICRSGRALALQPANLPAERFNFELPGSVPGFHAEGAGCTLENVPQHSALGRRSLAARFPADAAGAGPVRISTATFIPPEALNMPGYGLIASPTLYPGQLVTASLSADIDAPVSLFVRAYEAGNTPVLHASQPVMLRANEITTLSWQVDGIHGGSPIAEVGVQIDAGRAGALYLGYLTWSGAPSTLLSQPPHDGDLWKKAWIKACDDLNFGWGSAIRICQDHGPGLLVQGEREWSNYTARATVIPHLAASAGIAVCVQGVQRYYALLLCNDQKARVVKRLDGLEVLAEVDFPWELDGAYDLSLTSQGDRLVASINSRPVLDVRDATRPLLSGAVALVIEEGRLDCSGVSIA